MPVNPMCREDVAPSSGWQGHLQLEFAQQQGATQLSHSSMQAPLKVQRPFYPEGEAVCHVVTLHTAGGVVGGDRLATEITLHPQAHGLITTAAAGKLYRSNGKVAQQTTRIAIATGACLEWLPQETIVFDGALYRQDLRVDLAEEALWIGWEIVRFGRSARGEQFAAGQWRSHTEIWQNGRPLWVDPQGLVGGSAMLTSQHGLAGCPVV
ncbi:MAG TPA: urease accessory protein UreD, partial [Chroococcidiopsis sp.]